jgi:hypothetical protein
MNRRCAIGVLAGAAGLRWPASAQSLATAPPREIALEGETQHVQGIDTDGVRLWVTSVDRAARKGYLFRFDARSGRRAQSIEVHDPRDGGARYHPGGLAFDGRSVWIPVAEYRASSTAVIQRRNADTLALEQEFRVDDHIGCIAATSDMLIGGNWDSRDFYVWNYQGNLARKVASATGNAYQDLKFRNAQLVASGTLPGRKGAIDWLDYPSLRLNHRVMMANTEKGEPLTREGMTIHSQEIWLLPEDSHSRLFILPIPK